MITKKRTSIINLSPWKVKTAQLFIFGKKEKSKDIKSWHVASYEHTDTWIIVSLKSHYQILTRLWLAYFGVIRLPTSKTLNRVYYTNFSNFSYMFFLLVTKVMVFFFCVSSIKLKNWVSYNKKMITKTELSKVKSL